MSDENSKPEAQTDADQANPESWSKRKLRTKTAKSPIYAYS